MRTKLYLRGLLIFLLFFMSTNTLLSFQSQKTNSSPIPTTQVFQRLPEPREAAFTILVPKGWQMEGGVLRIDPLAQGGPAQSIGAKVDFAVKNDATGSVMIRWLPDILYYDARMSPAGQMGLFPPGSNYQGMTVWPLLSADQFITQIVFPYAHPNARAMQIIDKKSLDPLAQSYLQRSQASMPGSTFSYDAGLITLSYQENNLSFKEKIVTVIENWGALGTGMWGNRETFLVRAPAQQFERWESILSIVQNSIIVNQQWLVGELRGQIERGQIALQTQQEVNRIAQEIVEHRQKTYAEIRNDMYLNLTDQEEYVNPFTNKVEIGSNQWQNRWVNDNGDIIYSNNQGYNPNNDVNLKRHDFKKSPVRKRFPE